MLSGYTDPGPIMKLEGTTQDSTSIVLSWEGPTCPNGVITGYYIYYRISNTIQSQPINSTGYTEERLISNERDVTYSLTDLRPGENYTIHVRAFTIDDNDTELIGMADTEILVELNDYLHLGYNVIVLTVCLVLAFVILCCLLIFIIVCCCWYCHRYKLNTSIEKCFNMFSILSPENLNIIPLQQRKAYLFLSTLPKVKHTIIIITIYISTFIQVLKSLLQY